MYLVKSCGHQWIGWSLVHLRLSIDETDRCNAWKGLRGVVEDDILEDCSPEALANYHTSPKSNDLLFYALITVRMLHVDLCRFAMLYLR